MKPYQPYEGSCAYTMFHMAIGEVRVLPLSPTLTRNSYGPIGSYLRNRTGQTYKARIVCEVRPDGRKVATGVRVERLT